MLTHREGWRYSGKTPEFFSGQSGCSCCPPPPPPPPPPFVYYRNQYGYLYGQTGVVPFTCEFCDTPGKQIAEKWQLEIDGVDSITPPDPCSTNAGGPTCANINGTWILTRGSRPSYTYNDGVSNVTETYCVWWSPVFTWVGTYPIPDPSNFYKVFCYGCANMAAYFVLTLATLRNTDTGLVINRSVDLSVSYPNAFSQGFTVWRPTAGENVFDCLGVNEMSLVTDSFHFGGDAGAASPFCCDGVPTTVFLLPL
jgi:hypothetical protein